MVYPSKRGYVVDVATYTVYAAQIWSKYLVTSSRVCSVLEFASLVSRSIGNHLIAITALSD